jgi:hypothetical protein
MVDRNTINPMLINICWRMRPAFDRVRCGTRTLTTSRCADHLLSCVQSDVNVRSAAFSLFAELCRFGHAETKAGGSATGLGLADADLQTNFIDQVHTFLPVFIVHCNDEDKTVSKVRFHSPRESCFGRILRAEARASSVLFASFLSTPAVLPDGAAQSGRACG